MRFGLAGRSCSFPIPEDARPWRSKPDQSLCAALQEAAVARRPEDIPLRAFVLPRPRLLEGIRLFKGEIKRSECSGLKRPKPLKGRDVFQSSPPEPGRKWGLLRFPHVLKQHFSVPTNPRLEQGCQELRSGFGVSRRLLLSGPVLVEIRPQAGPPALPYAGADEPRAEGMLVPRRSLHSDKPVNLKPCYQFIKAFLILQLGFSTCVQFSRQ